MEFIEVISIINNQAGPRAKKFLATGFLASLFWDHYKYPQQSSRDLLLRDLTAIENESEEQILDRWCRGQNLIRFAPSIIHAVDSIRAVLRKRKA
jgi:hypothetical protein